MYNESYDTYIRSILGYQDQNDIFNSPNYENNYNQFSNTDTSNYRNMEVENMYPEIYQKVYPMVVTACQNNTRPITTEVLENMTDEIIMSLENMEGINVNINLRNDIKSSTSNRSESKADTKVSMQNKTKENVENRDSRIPNRGLRDIIRILLLRELFGRPPFFPPHRPPMRPPFPEPRPPMRPPFPGMRPPMRPRDFDNDIYEF